MMIPRVFDNHDAMSQGALAWLLERTAARPAQLVCLAAGGTPARTYELLADRGRRDAGVVAGMRFLQLDEWGGLSKEDASSCQSQLHNQLIAPLGAAARFTAFDGQASDPVLECWRVAKWLAEKGPIDVCILGLGVNGHLGFNEPADQLRPHAHVAELSSDSLAHAMVGPLAEKPTYGMTLGMADILQSREVLLLVSGARKGQALAQLLSGSITTAFPASLLHLHRHVTLLCDADAARQATPARAFPSSPAPAK